MKKRKNVTFIGHTMDRGGASRVLSILANHFANIGWDVDLIFFRIRNKYDISDNVNLIQLCDSDDKISYLSLIFKLRKYINTTYSSILVSFLMPVNFLTIISSIGLNKRVIISERNDPLKSGKKFWKRLADCLYRKADVIVFQTKRVQSYFPEKIRNKSVIILNPVNVSIKANRSNTKKIVSVGKLYPQKNHRLLINSFYDIHKQYPDYTLHIYGDGPLRDKLEKQIDDLMLNGVVYLKGNHPDVHEQIKDAEMFVLSSDYEGLSNALMEAMMMGIPCISTDCAGSDEIINHGENGLLFSVGDKKNLVEAMKKLIIDKKYAIKMGENAKETSRLFSVENVILNWEKIFKETDFTKT